MQLSEGAVLQDGKYRIIRVLGQGGFGITYLAENTFFETRVAIKEFFPKNLCERNDSTTGARFTTNSMAETVELLRKRFLKEARNIAKLDQPGIVKIHDIFEENDTAYYVMDYVYGESLHEIVKREGPLPEGRALKYIRAVGESLEYIHSHKMTHFDVKPANIVVRKSDDTPVLIDFGLSKQYDSQGEATSTLLQAVSHGYSAIELYNSTGITSFSPQTDVYSLAATLLYLLTGIQPPQASVIIEDGLNLPYTIDGRIAEAIKIGMAPSRRNRYPSVAAFLKALPQIEHTKVTTTVDNDDTEILGNQLSAEAERKLAKLQERVIELSDEIRKKDSEIHHFHEEKAKTDEQVGVLVSNNLSLEKKITDITAETEKKIKSGRKWKIAFILALLATIFCSFLFINKNNDYYEIRNEYWSRGDRISVLNEVLEQIATSNEVFISDVEVKNGTGDYEEKIYGDQTTFINPRFKVVNLSDEHKEVGVKFYTPTGLSTGTLSKNGYSYTDTIPAGYGYTNNPNEWDILIGWGGEEKGHWSPGEYRIELWVDGKCAATKHFTVYKE